MRNSTRLVFNKYTEQQAKLNGVSSATQKFDINPAIQQRLEDRIQESSGFLQQINVVPVTEQEGEVLGLGISGAIASRTNTRNGTPRQAYPILNRLVDFFLRIRLRLIPDDPHSNPPKEETPP
jgi:hypothetical protein